MKVRLDKASILEGLYSEEELSELSILESFYSIRKLKTLIDYGESVIEVNQINDYSQCFIEKFDIWVYCIPID